MEANDILSSIALSSADSISDKLSAVLEKRLQETAALTSNPTQGSASPEKATLNRIMVGKDSILVINKSDLVDDDVKDTFGLLESAIGQYRNEQAKIERSVCFISCRTGQGMDNFLDTLRIKVEAL